MLITDRPDNVEEFDLGKGLEFQIFSLPAALAVYRAYDGYYAAVR
jgi:hypothetical protein